MRHRRHRLKALTGGDRFHRAAVGMAADHDIRHAQRNHGIFDGRGNAARLRPERRHDIPGITNDKELSRLLLGNQFRHQTAVRTGDEKRFGILAGGQAAEEFFTLGEDLFLKVEEALNDMLHSSVSSL
ncbi:hypothetical protein KPHVMX_140029 [Klebsiella pneumoniae]|nr:hypothetical protein KPHVMX_140029 [Klebsiella pneumoniae]